MQASEGTVVSIQERDDGGLDGRGGVAVVRIG